MSKKFMPEISQSERMNILQQNADKIEQTTYLKPLSEDELSARRESLTDNSIRLSDLEEDKKEATKQFKDQIDPLKSANKTILVEIRTKQAKVDGTLYFMANHEESMMETYDDTGEMIESRRLRPDEKQGRLALHKAM